MDKEIRLLNETDYPRLMSMDTGLGDDYVLQIFKRLVTENNNRLYGLFLESQLISVGGYTIFANQYAMLGRLRSDRRFRGNNVATTLMSYMANEAFKQNGIQWVGANTQEDNVPARRVLKKLGFPELTTLHGALSEDPSSFVSGTPVKPWHKLGNLERKKELINKYYIKNSAIFPYECYYPFPASMALFPEKLLEEWSFYENDKRTRFLIMRKDRKKHYYLHVIYPWTDMTEQAGLWETISIEYEEFAMENMEDQTYIWMDLTKVEALSLPENHPFILPSPWILHGMYKTDWKKR
ncbi:GNAT family N-acetyltransferase [Oceanobacillus salinisoli]|uniref:GNAT family N-acetyltransferase n=1 Tax=Oceanobacillus salinisoli TaxID=2678611 RepID=UPI0012E1E698|nr:GNAT family N-acetyltransferase [Oceanobacillus salinisoli]